MAFAFKRTIPAQQVSVSLTPREWEVVRKCLSAYTDSELPAFEQAIAAAAEGAPWLQDADEWKQFVHAGTSEVEVKVGDEVLYDGEWLQVVALSRNGEEAVVDRGDGGVYVLSQEEVGDHRPAQEAPQPAQEALVAKYVPKIGDRVRASSPHRSWARGTSTARMAAAR